MQRIESAIHIDGGVSACEALFGAFFGLARPLEGSFLRHDGSPWSARPHAARASPASSAHRAHDQRAHRQIDPAIEMKAGARVEGDLAGLSLAMEPGVYFSGRCTMLESGPEAVELTGGMRTR